MAWARIAEVYSPLIIHWCSRLGLNEHDCHDCCQQILLVVIRYGASFRKENEGDRFRKWLWTVTRREVQRFKSAPSRLPTSDAAMLAVSVCDIPTSDSSIDNHYFPWGDTPVDNRVSSEVILRALQIVRNSCREQTWDIFMAAISDEMSLDAIASRFSTTTGNVRQIKFRLLARLRDLLELTDDAET
jgi:RNA polymerase sigma-70 factor, ECF subfamily